jgi:hypothetical protein
MFTMLHNNELLDSRDDQGEKPNSMVTWSELHTMLFVSTELSSRQSDTAFRAQSKNTSFLTATFSSTGVVLA